MLRVLCNVMVKHRDTPDPTVEKFFNAVAILTMDDVQSVQIVISPTSPKPRPNDGGSPPPPPPVVSVELAAKGLGSAGCVDVPPQTWDNIVEETSLSAMAGVQLAKTEVCDCLFFFCTNPSPRHNCIIAPFRLAAVRWQQKADKDTRNRGISRIKPE